ncbi:pyridoxal phosphate phosphatase, putative [Phytophthora infestans T30-4]|uniref:Pyridoxal phosphate phosphatase, putative n=1 Tax=Phytophthora infestans (strain T30-4) TaxID=403677 RepID=D0N6N7_PHYIT|nr:pyridoxal phosphate phosphatase, putative [Phytophthora infestans T30-4]EEY53236.1 pyridoxal phosphate phosphatase, putative [Phytophthora infestans T30-4]|eukprot:XP_002904854.1 pyridoxal phosphate phosphatase, putative [Phytophthora infestans T30-4]
MDEFFVQLAKERPQLTHEDIRNAAQRLPFKQHMLDAIRLAVDDFGATCKIVSDSTVFGVQSFLERHDLVGRVSEVVANPTHFEDGGKVLRVRPNQGDHVAPHGCQDCATNLCKGVVLDRILQQHRYSRGRRRVCSQDILAYFRSFFYRQYPECRQPNASDTLIYAEQDGNFSVPTPMPRETGELLVVFDFDDSLVNEDSDVFVFGSLHPELCQTVYERHAKKPIWPSVFDDMLQVLSSEKPHVTPELIRDAVAQIPIQARMIDAIRMAVELFGAEVKVISDGNTFYIESMLQHRELSEHVKEVFANPVEHETLDDGRTRLRIRPYHADHLDPHGCTWCPTNMCKGSILDSIRNGKSYSRVIYIGDGTGDFCPASRLTENDVVLARSHLVNGNPYGLQRRINENPGVVHAPVVSWSTGYDIYRRFAQFCPSPYVIPRVTPRISGSVLVVFDYDWSLVNENSDTFIFQQLYPQLLDTLRERRKTQPSWTKIMDDMLGVLAEDKANITSDTIRATVARVPIQTHMLDALRLAAEIHSADVKIVSDANSVYIESMLEHHGLTQDVSEVITNPASFELEENGCSRLRVRPYHGVAYEPHGCKWCPTNMCKGRIVDILRNTHSYTSVLYVGDGSGDFCAATHLTKNDVKRIDSNAEMVKAAVVPWSTGDDIYRHFAQFFHAPPQ